MAGTVVSNVLEHGCGGVNIDACRIDTGGEVLSCSKADPYHAADGTQRTWNPTSTRGIDRVQHESGRWPANLICAEGCPAKALDQQSGIVPTGSWIRPEKAYSFYLEKDDAPGKREEWKSVKEPESGASRFFKNIKDDLVSYLRDLITPPDGVVEVVPLDILEPTGEDESVHGFIVMGTPTQEQADELLRICKPGAHVLLIAPEEQPTGHTGMCRLEDAGFEIRDTIMLLLEAGGFWYVPKPTKTEREAGTHNLAKNGDTPTRGNSHPTVKPYAIMEALMKDAPKELPVVDPFMGSGSTGIAALHTGHDFIGIEREEDYMKIADARIRHWDQAAWRGRSVKIQSDVEQYTEADEDISLSDLFGSGG
ncbi:MAG: DNA methyltransferase [Planctomycetota bacterium]|nr:DNA methyltransferase [Planctomycetota bacterium]